jgi:hypothetical protein
MFVRAGVLQIVGLASALRYAMEKGKIWKGIPCAWAKVELRSYLKVPGLGGVHRVVLSKYKLVFYREERSRL